MSQNPIRIDQYDDDTILKFGIHKGLPLSQVPDHYLLFLYHENKAHGPLKKYIEENLDAIKFNVRK